MSLKLSPGCKCCDSDEGCAYCTTTTPSEMDMTFDGFYNNEWAGGMCSDCDTTIDGTYRSRGTEWVQVVVSGRNRAADPPTGAFATCDSGQYEFWICYIRLWLTAEDCDASPPTSDLNWKFQAQFNERDTSSGAKGICTETLSSAALIGYGTIAALPHTFDCSAVSNFAIDNICNDPVSWWSYCWWDSSTLDVQISAG